MASDFENLDDLDWADVEGELEANRDAILSGSAKYRGTFRL